MTLTTAGRVLAAQWVELCAELETGGRILSHDDAAEFLDTMAAALSRLPDDGGGAEAVAAAGRAFAWGTGSPSAAVEQLVALRRAVNLVLAPSAPTPLLVAIDELLDAALVAVVRDSVVELERDALLDPLTGLFNRRALRRNLELEIGRASRHEHRFTIVFIDVDGLKRVNDSRGHAAGDDVLASLAASLTAALRRGDSAYRIGGDEFVVLLPETDDDAVAPIMARLGAEGAPEVTWGKAIYPTDGATAGVLLETADRRLLERRRRRLAQPARGSEADVGFLP